MTMRTQSNYVERFYIIVVLGAPVALQDEFSVFVENPVQFIIVALQESVPAL